MVTLKSQNGSFLLLLSVMIRDRRDRLENVILLAMIIFDGNEKSQIKMKDNILKTTEVSFQTGKPKI